MGCGWSRGSLDDTTPSDDVIPPLAYVNLLSRGTSPLRFRSDRLACDDALSATLGRFLCKIRLRFLPLHTVTVFRCVVSPAVTALRLFPRGRASNGELEAPQVMHRGAYQQLRCVWPKRWQRLHCSRSFGAAYDSTDTRKPQSSVSDRTLDTSGPRASDTMKWGWEGGPLRGPDRDGRIAAT